MTDKVIVIMREQESPIREWLRSILIKTKGRFYTSRTIIHLGDLIYHRLEILPERFLANCRNSR
jgi:hypothetical protein